MFEVWLVVKIILFSSFYPQLSTPFTRRTLTWKDFSCRGIKFNIHSTRCRYFIERFIKSLNRNRLKLMCEKKVKIIFYFRFVLQLNVDRVDLWLCVSSTRGVLRGCWCKSQVQLEKYGRATTQLHP